jgi:hypothetical protein
LPRPWITASQLPTAAWTTLRVAHKLHSLDDDYNFSPFKGRERPDQHCS